MKSVSLSIVANKILSAPEVKAVHPLYLKRTKLVSLIVKLVALTAGASILSYKIRAGAT